MTIPIEELCIFITIDITQFFYIGNIAITVSCYYYRYYTIYFFAPAPDAHPGQRAPSGAASSAATLSPARRCLGAAKGAVADAMMLTNHLVVS